MDKLNELVQRRRAWLIFRVLAAFQFSAGFLLVFFAVYIAAVLHGANTGAPYYVGALIAGLPLLILSTVEGTIYYRAKTTRLEILVPTRVKPWVVAHLIISPCVAALCIVGVVITGIYGICRSDKCSYSTNNELNFGMAAFLLVLEILCLISSFTSIFVSVYYASCLGLHLFFIKKSVNGTVQVRPMTDEVQIAQDMYVQQLWRHKMQNDIDFRKVAEYLEQSRKKQPEQEEDDT